MESDGSGKVQLAVTIPKLGLRWLPGKPQNNWIRPSLPPDVTLKSFEASSGRIAVTDPKGEEHDLEAETYTANFTFKTVTSLNDTRVQPEMRSELAPVIGAQKNKNGGAMMMAKANHPSLSPFQKIELTAEKDPLHFRRIVQSARKKDDVAASTLNTPGANNQPVAIDLGDSTLNVMVVCPGGVIEHNADSVNGQKLVWNFKLKELQENQDRDWVVEFKWKKEDQR